MSLKLPEPFNIDTIERHPKAVVISLLIGLLLVACSVVAFLFNRRDDDRLTCKKDKQVLINTIINERNDRIKLYEGMIFYKKTAESLQDELEAKDSIVREKTEGLVKKILK